MQADDLQLGTLGDLRRGFHGHLPLLVRAGHGRTSKRDLTNGAKRQQMIDPESLQQFLETLPDVTPTVPDELTQHYLKVHGFDCSDIRMVRLVSLAAQKFVAEVTHDALQLWKQQRQAPQQKLREQGIDPKDRRPVLSMEHVANALQEYGLDTQRPPYFADATALANRS